MAAIAELLGDNLSAVLARPLSEIETLGKAARRIGDKRERAMTK